MVNYNTDGDGVPEELRGLQRWCCWRFQDKGKGKKPGKVPTQALVNHRGPHRNASPTDPSTWATFDEAVRYYEQRLLPEGRPCGVGLALNGDGLVGLDLDDCVGPKAGQVAGWARDIVRRFATYTELSPSGTGLRLYLRGRLPKDQNAKAVGELPHLASATGRIEAYCARKVLTTTGRRITSFGATAAVQDRAEELLAWYEEVFGAPSTGSTKKAGDDWRSINVVADPGALAEERLAALFQAKPEVERLFHATGRDLSSIGQSLANHAGWFGFSDQEVAALLVQARPDDPKGARLDYLQRTIWTMRQGVQECREGKGRHRTRATARPSANGAARHGAGGKATDPAAGAKNRNAYRGGEGEPQPAQDRPQVTPITIAQARKVFQRHLHLPDPNVVDLVLAVVAGNKLLETDPLWLFLKGPPGSGKTELVSPFKGLDDWAVLVSNLTPAALISGYIDPRRDAPDPSLLPQLDGKTLIIKDFTTVLAMNPVQRDEVFGILRDVYDGHAAKNFGTGRKEYKSRFNLLAGVTSAIESCWSLSALGERFLTWAMEVDPKEQARRALQMANTEGTMREELATAAAGVLAGLPATVPTAPALFQEKTLALAFLLAKLRTYVDRDRNDVVHRPPEVEVPTRIVKQLSRLGQSLALVRRKGVVTDDEFAVMRKVALDSMPTARRAIFLALADAKGPEEVGTLAGRCRISPSAAKRHLDDLALLGVADRGKAACKGRQLAFALAEESREEWGKVCK